MYVCMYMHLCMYTYVFMYTVSLTVAPGIATPLNCQEITGSGSPPMMQLKETLVISGTEVLMGPTLISGRSWEKDREKMDMPNEIEHDMEQYPACCNLDR